MLDCAIILPDNACPHITMSVTVIFQKYGWEMLKHPQYNPDLSPLDYDLFPKLKKSLRAIRFNDLSELSLAVTREIWWLNLQSCYVYMKK